MAEKFLLTQEGIEKLQKERDTLINVERQRVIEELQAARAQGDLSENADYDAARDKQAQVESRIKEIDNMLANVELIDNDSDGNTVVPGVQVTLYDLADNIELVYTIVGSFETDPRNGKISNESPLAKAILGKPVGTIATVMVEEPYDVEIKGINK